MFLRYHGLNLDAYTRDELVNALHVSTLDTNYYASRERTGQLKLILCEIAFIEWAKSRGNKCTPFQVCGGAPGTHYDVLSQMYPEITFVLYDLRPFHDTLRRRPNVTLKQKYVTRETVASEFDSSGLFVSDIRTLELAESKKNIVKGDDTSHVLYDSLIARDMYDQLSFFNISKCEHAMLKFKVPERMSFSYVEGTLWIQPFINTNELRLVTSRNATYRVYDGHEIDMQCQLVNNYWRYSILSNNDRRHQQFDLSEWPRGNDIKKELDKLASSKSTNWDTIALIDILLASNKIEFIDKIRDEYYVRRR